jgi:lysophospholipase L1-like esterase
MGGGMTHYARMGGGDVLRAESGRDASGKKTRLVIIGASYARGWTDGSRGKFVIVNKGVNGEQSFEMLARFKRDVIDEHPDIVIIWGFINDIFRSSREGIDPTLERTRRSIITMVDIARANGIKPVVATEVTIRGRSGIKETLASWIGRLRGVESYQDYVNRCVLKTNQWIKEYAREQGIPILDFQPLLADEEGRRKKEYAAADGSHLSAAAYKRLAEYADKYIGSWSQNGH